MGCACKIESGVLSQWAQWVQRGFRRAMHVEVQMATKRHVPDTASCARRGFCSYTFYVEKLINITPEDSMATALGGLLVLHHNGVQGNASGTQILGEHKSILPLQ